MGLLEDINELSHNTLVASVEEGSGNTSVTGSTSSTNSMDVIVDVSGEVVVDNVGNVGDIKTSGSDGSGNENGGSTVSEHLESSLSVSLRSVTVNGGGREVFALEDITEVVSTSLGLDEDKGQALASGRENIKESGDLVTILDVLNLLGNVLRSRTNTTNGQENVVLQEVSGEHLDVSGEGGGEHESLSLLDTGHAGLLDNGSNLRLETHIKHSIGLIKDKVLDVLERDTASVNQIDESTGGGDKKVTASLDVSHLLANVGTTVDDTRSNPRSVGKLLSLLVNLGDKLSGGGKDEGSGVSLLLHVSSSSLGDLRGSVEEGLRENGEEETTSLTGTSLGTSHKISASSNDGDGVLLHGSGLVVSSQSDVGEEVGLKGRRGESVHRLGNVITGSLNRNLVVVVEVNTGGLESLVVGSAEEVDLCSLVLGTGLVLAVNKGSLGGVSESGPAATKATVVAPASATTATTAAAVATTVAATGVVVLERVGVLGVQVSASLSSVVRGGRRSLVGAGGSSGLGSVRGDVLASRSGGVVQIQRLNTIFEFRHTVVSLGVGRVGLIL